MGKTHARLIIFATDSSGRWRTRVRLRISSLPALIAAAQHVLDAEDRDRKAS